MLFYSNVFVWRVVSLGDVFINLIFWPKNENSGFKGLNKILFLGTYFQVNRNRKDEKYKKSITITQIFFRQSITIKIANRG